MEFLYETESKGKRYTECGLSFTKDNKNYNFDSNSAKNLFCQVINWLHSSGYKFEGTFHSKSNPTRCLLTQQEVEDKVTNLTYSYKDFCHISDTNLWIMCCVPIKRLFKDLFTMLDLHGVTSIKTEGLDDIIYSKLDDELKQPKSQIKKFTDMHPKQSPFKDAICILGESGAGKSFRVEKTLEEEGHNFEMIVPSIATSSLLVQYNTTTRTFTLSKLGNMMKQAKENPQELYTVVFDECHKYIDIINDELLQCLSTKRNNGLRFISLDPVTEEMYDFLETNKGRKIIPDNLGFIFISSKEDIVKENDDFRNRMIFITITKGQRELEFKIDKLLDLRERTNSNRFTV